MCCIQFPKTGAITSPTECLQSAIPYILCWEPDCGLYSIVPSWVGIGNGYIAEANGERPPAVVPGGREVAVKFTTGTAEILRADAPSNWSAGNVKLSEVHARVAAKVLATCESPTANWNICLKAII
jgi:hypothetical protein